MSNSNNEQMTMFDKNENQQNGPVICLGMTFNNDEERRAYFIEELRKKLPKLKKIEGFPIGEDEDILALSDPPYYTACPNPWLKQSIEEWEQSRGISKRMEDYHREPFAVDVSEGKSDQIYGIHSYHTKVPHKAIMRYILHYTMPGDIVYDGFSGTGMTGVAARKCGDRDELTKLGYKINANNEVIDENNKYISTLGERNCILNDLSPVAALISYNYNTDFNLGDFRKEINGIIDVVNKECSWMFETKHCDKQRGSINKGKINYVVWSDVFHCPNCSEELIFFDIAVDEENRAIKKDYQCNSCLIELKKKDLERAWETIYDTSLKENIRVAKQRPVLINYTYQGKRFDKLVDQEDMELLEKINSEVVPYWHPVDELPHGFNTAQPKGSHGIKYVHQFYTKRNLWVMSALLNHARESKFYNVIQGIVRSSTSYSTKMVKVNVPRLLTNGGLFSFGAVSGTLYIPSLSGERPILDAIKSKVDAVIKGKPEKQYNYLVTTQDSGKINTIPSNSVDYIFVDPPFGSNLMYSELNFLWESWLKVKTNNETEAIVNKEHDKSIIDYKKLMTDCFRENYRILKPGRWMTIEFSNSQSVIWNTIRESIEKSGFVIANVQALDKKQGSFKAVTTTTAVKQDLVISAYKPKEENIEKMKKEQNTEESSWTFVKQHLEQLPVFIGERGEAQLIVERTPRIIFDRMIAYHVQNSLPVPISSAEFQEGITQRFPMRDGMAFLESQVAEYDKKRILVKEFSQMSLFVSDENSAIEWIRQQIMNKPQTRQDLHPNYMKEIQHIAKHELLPELDQLLEQNFLMYEGNESVPSQIHTYLSTNYKDLRGLDKGDPRLKEKAKGRWYVPDPNKQADLEKLREKSLLREFAHYKDELDKSKKKLKQFRTEAIRAGFKKAWGEKDYNTIVKVGERLPESVIQEDDKLLMYFDNAQIRLGM